MSKIRVGVLGATGAVGQRFAQMLTGHPYFDLQVLAASERSAGKAYQEATNWILTEPMPAHLAEMTVQEMSINLDCEILFSALPTSEAREWESKYAAAGYAVFSNAGAHRMDDDVPLLIPEVNPDHLDCGPVDLSPPRDSSCGGMDFARFLRVLLLKQKLTRCGIIVCTHMRAIRHRKKHDIARKTMLGRIVTDFLHKALRFLKTTLQVSRTNHHGHRSEHKFTKIQTGQIWCKRIRARSFRKHQFKRWVDVMPRSARRGFDDPVRMGAYKTLYKLPAF